MILAAKLGPPLAVFAAVTGLALVVGARALGVAGTFGQLAFAVAVVVVLLRDSRGGTGRRA
jgi:hypothetical protein